MKNKTCLSCEYSRVDNDCDSVYFCEVKNRFIVGNYYCKCYKKLIETNKARNLIIIGLSLSIFGVILSLIGLLI